MDAYSLSKLKDAVEAHPLTKAEIAARCGYDPSHLSRVLHGRTPLVKRFVVTVSQVIGRNPDDFLVKEEASI